jgi:hypothetical protein
VVQHLTTLIAVRSPLETRRTWVCSEIFDDLRSRGLVAENTPDWGTFDLFDEYLNDVTSDPVLQGLLFASPQMQMSPKLPQEQPADSLPILRVAGERQYRFEFLITFARCTGFATCFECGSATQRRQILTNGYALQNQAGKFEEVTHSQDSRAPDDISWIGGVETDQVQKASLSQHSARSVRPIYDRPRQALSHSAIDASISHFQPSPQASQWASWLADPLAIKTHEIVHMIKEVTCNKARTSVITANWSPLLEAMCFQVFCPPQMKRFLALFWSAWYPNCPISHKPTFAIHRASAGLLASMTLIGASVSLEDSDRSNARPWFDIIEEMVFEDKTLYNYSMGSSNYCSKDGSISRERLDALQAAYFVCSLQHWEAREVSGRRIQKHRHNTLVMVRSKLLKVLIVLVLDPL